MSTETIDYAAVLADLEQKRALLDSTIASLRAVLAGVGLTDTVPSSGSGGHAGPQFQSGEIPAGAFHGKSIPEAAKIYLEIVKKKQSTREIMEALLKGGMETTSDNFESTVAAGLNRAKKLSGEIAKVSGGWGLASWYHPGVRAAANQPAKTTKKKPKSKAKAKANAKAKPPSAPKAASQSTPASETKAPTTEQADPSGPQSIIEECMAAYCNQSISAKEIAEAYGIKIQTVGLILGKLVKAGKVEKHSDGFRGIPSNVQQMPRAV